MTTTITPKQPRYTTFTIYTPSKTRSKNSQICKLTSLQNAEDNRKFIARETNKKTVAHTGQISVDVAAYPQDNIEEMESKKTIVELNDVFTPTQRALNDEKILNLNDAFLGELDLYQQDYRNVVNSLKKPLEEMQTLIERHKNNKKYNQASGGPKHMDLSFLIND